MKPLYWLPVLLFLCSVAACSKKENAKPIVKPTTIDSAKVSTGSTVQVSQYPYTDTFIGTLSVLFSYDYYSNLDTNHSAYRFYVTHLSENVVVFNCSQSVRIMNEWLYWLTDKPDTGALDVNGEFNGTLFVYNTYPTSDSHNEALPAVYKLQNNGRTLSVSWDDTYFPVPGTCDGGESKGQYTGVIK